MSKSEIQKIKLLLIEDDETQVFLIKESLNPDKYEITNIQNGKDAFQFLVKAETYPDLILLDYHLPMMDGLSIMGKLRELGRMPNFIFLTADYSIETALKSINAGALEFIPKDGRFIRSIPEIINRTVVNIRIKAEKERIQKALSESEERIKTVMEASRDGILEHDLKTGKMSMNPNCSLMLGYWPNEIPDHYNDWLALIHPNDLNAYKTTLENQILHGESLYETEFRIKCKDNSFKWVHERGIVIPDKQTSKPLKVISTRTDISERKKNEENLKHSEYLYNTTINSIKDLIVVIDNEYIILLINDSMRLFNKTHLQISDVIFKNFKEIYPTLFDHNQDLFEKIFKYGEEHLIEDHIITDQQTHFFEIRFSPVVQNHNIVRIVITIRDITEKKNLEKIVMKAIIDTEEKERKRFSEDLHDDLGAILSTIKIYINTLNNEEIAREKRDQMVTLTNELINQAIQNAREIANNLSPSVIKRFGLTSAIQTFCENIQIAHNISIDYTFTPIFKQLSDDQAISVYRIINELINNTLKHANANNIKLDIEEKNQKIKIDYFDNGKGFDFEKSLLRVNNSGHGISNIITRIKSMNGKYWTDKLTVGFNIKIELFTLD